MKEKIVLIGKENEMQKAIVKVKKYGDIESPT